jgi:hypothetical protein
MTPDADIGRCEGIPTTLQAHISVLYARRPAAPSNHTITF